MAELINVVLPIFIVIFIGYLIGRFTSLKMDSLVDAAIYIGAPALVFLSLLEHKIVMLDAVRIWTASLLIMGGCGLAAWLVFKALRQRHRGLYVPIAMMNTVYIPFPVVYLAYGSTGLMAASLFSIPNNLLLNSLAIYMMAGKSWKENIREMFKLPVFYAAVAGLAFNLLDISLPKLVYDPLNLIGMMLLPLVLLILGHNLSRFRLNSLPTTLLASFLRVGVGLGLGLLVAEWLGLSGIFRSVVILDAAMPAATTAVILATKYDNERELVSSVVSLTTLASLVIIPFLLHVLA